MLLSFNKCSISVLGAPTMYLSANRVNGIGENSNFSSQLRAELHCVSPIPYHVFPSYVLGASRCVIENFSAHLAHSNTGLVIDF